MDTTKKPGFLANLSDADRRELAEFLESRIKDSFLSDPRIKSILTDYRSNPVNLALANVVAKTGTSEEEALLLAITLYDLAVDAAANGQRLVLLDKDYHFVKELVGLGLKKPEAVVHESVTG